MYLGYAKKPYTMVRIVFFITRYAAQVRLTLKVPRALCLKESDITQYSTAFMSNTKSPLIDDCLLLLQTLTNPLSSKP